MPPKKQAKLNAFALFAQELMNKQGRKFKSMKEACDGAAPLWANMSRSQKQPYEQMAKNMRGESTRLTSEGLSVDQITQEFSKKNEAEGIARANIRCIIEDAKKRNALDTETFFFVHCNFFCYANSSDEFLPAEIGVLAFNLREGVKPENIFHRMIEPGPLPIGYAFSAKQHSQETHMINLPSEDQQNNQFEVYMALREFIERKTVPGSGRPIFYANNKDVKIVQKILDDWVRLYEVDEPSAENYRVYDIHLMLFHLKNSAAGDEVWTSTNFSGREIEKDVYAYVPDIACEFHALSENPLYCSKSIVCRYAFIISDNCCRELNIELIEGQHIPARSVLPSAIPNNSSRDSFSGRRSTSTRSLQSDYSSDFGSEIWETESLTSEYADSCSSATLDEDFPSLASSRCHSRASAYSAQTVTSSQGKSYAGATGRSKPTALENGIARLSLASSSSLKTPGWTNNPDYSATGSGDQDFPPIARGRGFRRGTPKKPGSEARRS